MAEREDLLTTREAARRLGIGPSSIKRWADAGLLACVRTAGGHRRFPADAIERLRRNPPVDAGAPGELSVVGGWADRLIEATDALAVEGELLIARSRLGSWCRVADDVGAALGELGDRWSGGAIGVLDEHAASERLSRALARCAAGIPVSREAPRCLLATGLEDDHTLGLSLAEPCLRELGWLAIWTGRRSPTAEVVRWIEAGSVDMVALSASAWSTRPAVLARQLAPMAAACSEAGIPLVLGGAGAWPERLPSPAQRLDSFGEMKRMLSELPARRPG